MSPVAPTRDQFVARFNEFAVVGDSTVEAVLDDAKAQVGTNWPETDYARAIMLLTAHLLLVEGHIDRAAGRKSTMTTTGAVQSKQVGEVRVTYAGAGTVGSAYPNGYGATEYGRRFYDLMRRNFSGPIVV